MDFYRGKIHLYQEKIEMSQQKIQMYQGKTVEEQLRKAEELLRRTQDAGGRQLAKKEETWKRRNGEGQNASVSVVSESVGRDSH